MLELSNITVNVEVRSVEDVITALELDSVGLPVKLAVTATEVRFNVVKDGT